MKDASCKTRQRIRFGLVLPDLSSIVFAAAVSDKHISRTPRGSASRVPMAVPVKRVAPAQLTGQSKGGICLPQRLSLER